MDEGVFESIASVRIRTTGYAVDQSGGDQISQVSRNGIRVNGANGGDKVESKLATEDCR